MFLKGKQPELDFRKVMEVRRLLEIEIAGMAAERRTHRDLVLMGKILRDVEGVREERRRFVQWDVAFHSALAAATANELFPLLLDSVARTMVKVRELGFTVKGSPANAIKHHHAIFREVEAGNVQGARETMRDHLVESETTLRRALALSARERV